MSIVPALEAIEAAPRGNARLEVLKQAAVDPEVRQFFADTLNPYVTFGVKQLPTCDVSTEPAPNWAAHLFALGQRLQTRELTGNAAATAIAEFLATCDGQQAKWATRYLKRDLRLDIGARAYNATLTSAGLPTVPLFAVPLAEPYDKVKPSLLREGEWIVEPKLDGARCVAVVDPQGVVTLRSRTGKTWGNFESIRLRLQSLVDKLGLIDVVFDGEVVSLDTDGFIDFQALQKTMLRGDGVEIGDLCYVVFDYALIGAEWRSPLRPYGLRHDDLQTVVARAAVDGKPQPRKVSGIDMLTCGSDQVVAIPVQPYQGADLVDICRAYVECGFEGAMLRRLDLPPVNKRSKALIKVKLFQEGEGTCVGLTAGEGKRSDSMGALVLRWSNGVEVRCGTGLSDAKLAELAANPPIGKAVTVKYFELTDDGVPRFPIFKCVRVAEDIPEEENNA